MLSSLHVRNFKSFDNVEIELGNPVLFVGPNDAGKTSALQALMLWDLGLRRWTEKRGGKTAPEKRPGVAINRRDLTGVPAPTARLLWRGLHVRNTWRTDENRQRTENVRIDVRVDGVTEGSSWSCGLEFDYTNEETFVCRPLRTGHDEGARMPVPDAAHGVQVAFLAPMSGLAANEPRLEIGAINVRIGEGRTAEVLRNLCHQVVERPDGEQRWEVLTERIRALFGVELTPPRLVSERGEIDMNYRTRAGTELDLSSSGRGMQQTLLLLSFLSMNPGSVVLLDEPDAHLEILRQRQTYEVLSQAAVDEGSQIIVASHSEVLLNEAADRDVVVAFVGQPHRIDDRRSQVMKALKEIGFEDYYQAEITGFVLYLEGSTDLAMLRRFAELLGHGAATALQRPFVHYVLNQPSKARDHFYGLREAKPNLVGFAVFDRIDTSLQDRAELAEQMWTRREIENYLCQPETLLRFAEDSAAAELEGTEPEGPLFASAEQVRRREAMEKSIQDRVPPAALRDPEDRFWIDTKASEDLLNPIFEAFYAELGIPNLMRKSDYHRLVRFVDPGSVDPEIAEVLDALEAAARNASPAGDPADEPAGTGPS
ncbi:MAG: AAA family ATPase [Thermoleophilaceae bacterium]|nr:AAA family ATPase [Thermoleophilaceae bacterium]